MPIPVSAPAQLADLLAGCQRQDRQHQHTLYRHYYGFAFSICLRYVSDHEVALEAVNDGFLKIFQELSHFDIARYPDLAGSLRGWMHRILVRTAIDRFRAEHRHTLRTDLDELSFTPVDAGHSPLDNLSFEELLALISRLSPTGRAVFNLYVIDGYSHEEIASQLSISVGASKTALFKARTSLKQFLKKTNHHAYAQYVR